MTVTTHADHPNYRIAICAPHGHPQRHPAGWKTTPITIYPATKRQTWLIHNPATHNIATLIATRPTSLHRHLIAAGAQQIAATPTKTLYLVPRNPTGDRSARSHPR